MYVRRFFNPRAKEEMIEMTSYIRKVFKEEISEELDWMDDKTRARLFILFYFLSRSLLYFKVYPVTC